METKMIIELVGYIGSALVLVSFLMTSVAKLRIVNSIGSFIFMVYALIIHSYPTAIMNFCLIAINIHFLWKMRHTGNQYDLVNLDVEDSYLQYLLKRHREDIESCFPGIKIHPDSGYDEINRAYLVTCKGAPAGITLGKVTEDASVNGSYNPNETPNETMDLLLDYSLPEFRDFSIGTFMMTKLREEGIDRLIYSGPTEHHMAYLNKMGFIKEEGYYSKNL